MTPLGVPLRWVVSVLHEGGHVLAALASGAEVLDVQIRAYDAETHTAGGLPLLILAAGYPAPALASAGLLRLGLWRPGWVLGACALYDVAEDIGRGDAAMLPGPPLLWSAAWAAIALLALRTTPRRPPRTPASSTPSRQ